jgi:hypothetical protein
MKLNLVGQRFGRLMVIAEAPQVGKQRRWVCHCDCGGEALITTCGLRTTGTKSCGCLAREHMQRVGLSCRAHGESWRQHQTPEYRTWAGMRARCRNEKLHSFQYYGGRGIRVCDRWRDSFEAFLADMGRRPSSNHSIDRINNDGNYEPGNCRWATRAQQAQNRRNNPRPIVGSLNSWAKLTEDTVREARRLRQVGFSFGRLARKFAVAKSTMQAAIKGQKWSHVL